MSTGISMERISFDFYLTRFINNFFNRINTSMADVYLYGGTALNRGFFEKKQRLSIDLDIEVPKKSFSKGIHDIKKALGNAGYTETESIKSKDTFAAYVHENGNEIPIRLEVRKQMLGIKKENINLHSLLEYYGVPTSVALAPSYPFEYLLAYKMNALAARMLYKDLYDVYTGLQMLKNKKEFTSYIDRIDRLKEVNIFDEIDDMVNSGIYRHIGESDKTYEGMVQQYYREDKEVMAKYIALSIKGLRKHVL